MGNPCNEDYLAVTGLKVKIQIRVNEDNSGYQPIGLLQWFTCNFWLVGLPCVDLHKLWSGVWSPGSTPYPDLGELHHQTHLAAGNSDRAGHSHCRLCQGEQRAKKYKIRLYISKGTVLYFTQDFLYVWNPSQFRTESIIILEYFKKGKQELNLIC